MSARASSEGGAPWPPIAVFRSALLHGSEPYIKTQAEAVPRYRSHYVGTYRTGSAIELPAERSVALGDHWRAWDDKLDRLIRLAHPRGRVAEWLQHGLFTKISRTLFEELGTSPYLLARLREIGPALLHAHTGGNAAFALPLVRRLGIPFVVTFHGYDATASDAELARRPIQGRVYLRRRAALQREADRLIAVSGWIRERLLEKGWPEERITVHYMGVDVERFAPALTPLGQREPIVFYAGRLIEKKGLEYLIDAMPAVQARIPGARVVIAGSGGRRASLERRAAERGARVEFVGYQSPGGIAQWMGRARLYCMPSVRAESGDGEGLPTAVVEALASGVPVVSTWHAGIPEAVRHGECGLLADERDTEGLVAHLTALLGDTERLERMGRAARARALEAFDHRKQAATLAALYDEVRAQHAARRGGRRLQSAPRLGV